MQSRLKPFILHFISTIFTLLTATLAAESVFAQANIKEASHDECSSEENRITDTLRYDSELMSRYTGHTIAGINISVKDVFDTSIEEENRSIFKFANRIQINTRKSVIKRQLLFDIGDPLNEDDIRETVRNLYRNHYLLESKILVDKVCKEDIYLRVVVRDSWVLEPKISFGRKGGENSSAIGFIDGNFLGSGNEVALIYENDPERDKLIYRVRSRRIFNLLDAELYHADLSDGEDNRLSLTKPFYSLSTKWSFGASTEKTTQSYKTRFQGEVVNQFNLVNKNDESYIGYAFNITDDHTHRIYLGHTREETAFLFTNNTLYTPEDTQNSYTWLEITKSTNKYKRFTNLSFIERTEDVAIGSNYSARYGRGKDIDHEAFEKFTGFYSNTISISDEHLFQLTFGLTLNHSENLGFKDSLGEISSRYYRFINGQNRWYINAAYSEGKNLSEHNQLTVGELQDVRGYPLAYERGNKRYVINIERRFYSNLHWFNLIRVGALVFIDVGKAWGSESFEETHHLRSAGIGLRLNSSKTGNPAVLHLNIGAPLADDRPLESYLVSLSVEGSF